MKNIVNFLKACDKAWEKAFYWPKRATSYTKADQNALHLAGLTTLILFACLLSDLTSTTEQRQQKMEQLKERSLILYYSPIDHSNSRLALILAANLYIKYNRRKRRLYEAFLKEQQKQRS